MGKSKMIVTVNKITEKGIVKHEHIARGVKFSGDLLAIDVIGAYWHVYKAGEFDNFTIVENKN